MSPKVTSERYKSYLNRQKIEPIDSKKFTEMLEKVQHANKKEARALCILLWATAARPNEILRLTNDKVFKEKNLLSIQLLGSKGSLPRTIDLPLSHPLIKEVWAYSKMVPPNLRLFGNFYSKFQRFSIQKTGKKGKKIYRKPFDEKGLPVGYPIYSSKLRYYFEKWFNETPYILRHNRLTIAAEDLSVADLMQLKGAKTEASVWPYVLMTRKQAKKISRSLIK